ncbi:MAG: 1-acyl-sn-glycerol-3-phosphate acyltransferase [Lysobacterales bacterium]
MISVLASILRFFFRSLLFIGYLLFLLTPTLMRVNHYRGLGTVDGSRKADAHAVRLANRLAWLFGIRVVVTGQPQSGPVLMAANHISWLDIPVLHSACAMGFVGKAEIESWPVFRNIARTGGTIFHQRGNHDSAAGVNSLMVQRLGEGRAVTIFPEGGIEAGVPIRIFHARMFKAAVDVGCPVQPVMVRYVRNGHIDTDVAFRVGESMAMNLCRQLARPKSVAEVHFLPVISAVDQPRRVLADGARAAVVGSYENRAIGS